MLRAMANRALRAGKDAQHYGVQAKSFKTLTAAARFSKVQASSLRIAAIYERLAELAESACTLSAVSKQANDVCQHQMHGGPAARRVTTDSTRASGAGSKHLRIGAAGEAEPRPARQEAPVKKLSNEDWRIAHAASLELSRALCDVPFMISRATRERLRRSISDDRSL